MSSFTLDDIRAAADRKYGSTDITVGETVCKLVNPLRLPKERRAHLMELQDQMEGDDQETVLADALRTISENEHQANVLLGAIGDDLATMAEVFTVYTEAQDAGEA